MLLNMFRKMFPLWFGLPLLVVGTGLLWLCHWVYEDECKKWVRGQFSKLGDVVMSPLTVDTLLDVGFLLLLVLMIVLASAYIAIWYQNHVSKLIKRSPLEIIFDPNNPSERFWSMESSRGENESLGSGVFWEYRVEIRNNSSKTIRNVSVTVEHTGQIPVRPVDQVFDKTRIVTRDLKPGSGELVPVLQWPIPIVQEGMLAGSSALEYGPIKVTAVADDVPLVARNFQFDYQAKPMLFK